HLDVRAGRERPLARSGEHRGPVRLMSVGLAHVGHDDRAAEPLAEQDRLLERGVGPRAAIESHQQTREHGYGSTANDSSSCSGNASSSPVIGSLPSSASSRPSVFSPSATTTYSVPWRRNATRRRSRTARSSASSASGVRRRNSRIALFTARSHHGER